MKYKIKKNFLDKESFDLFKQKIFSQPFAWYWQPHQVNPYVPGAPPKGDRGFLAHAFYVEHKPNSDFYQPFIVPIIKKLGCRMISDVRANCLFKDSKKHFSHFHCDRTYDCTTAILYMNTNNGYTLLGEKEKIKIKSEENKIVIFNSGIKHCAVSQTDTTRRIVINFNYI